MQKVSYTYAASLIRKGMAEVFYRSPEGMMLKSTKHKEAIWAPHYARKLGPRKDGVLLPGRIEESEVDEWVNLYPAMSCEEIANKSGRSVTSVQVRLKMRGIKLRTYAEACRLKYASASKK